MSLCVQKGLYASCCRFRLVAEPAGSIMVAPSLYGGADDGEVPDDPWATAAREANQSADDDTAEIYARPRRAWRRGEAGETPDGASNGPPTTGNHEQFLPGDRNVREETWEDPAWQSWEGYDGTRNFFSGGPRHWHQWSEGWPRNDWATDGWNSQSSSTTAGYDTAGPALAATTSWTRTSSGATTRRASGDHLRDWQPQGGQQWSQGTTWETRGDEKDRRGGVSEKMSVPVFSAEDQGEKLGSSARSYIRQIEAWTQVTRAPKAQQALLLYQALTGRAWIEAEELQVTELATDEGVEKFKAWITERYQEIEVGKIAEALNGFFKKLRRTPGQSIREFNAAFDRSYARLLEVDCRLPETAKAWAYLNALALSHAEELTILGSVSNEFITARLQRAAVLHEKSLKRPWENRRSWEKDGVPARSPGRPNTAMNTDNREEEPGWAEEAYEADELDDEEAKIFEAYMTAKHQYKDVLRARGLDQEGIKRATDEKIALAKSKSFCSVCKQRGHWHRDPECPMRSSSNDKGGRDRTADKVQTAHAIFETNTNLGETLLAITDCACTKSVMGTSWLQRFVDVLKGMNVEVPLLPEQDNFRFGASRIYTSSYAVVVPLRLGSHWVLIRASVVHGDLPLLVSRGALASLGMVYDLEHHVADFVKVGVTGHPLLTTPSGHPALNVHPGDQGLPSLAHPKMWNASKSIRGDIQILSTAEAYMVGHAGNGFGNSVSTPSTRMPQIFYEKKISPEVRNMLSGDVLPLESFVKWWQTTKLSADFWIETPEALIRVHVVPRKTFFSPEEWRTQQSLLRDNLLRVLGSMRGTFAISCRALRDLPVVHDFWEQCKGDCKPCQQCLWVGRTVFNRRELCASYTPSLPSPWNVPAPGMADDEAGAVGRGDPPGPRSSSRLDRGGAAERDRGDDPRPTNQFCAEGPQLNEVAGAQGRGGQDRVGLRREGDPRNADEEHPGLPRDARQHCDDDRQAPRQHLQPDPRILCSVGGRGGEGQRREHAPRPPPLRDVAQTTTGPRAVDLRDDPGEDEQPREVRGRGPNEPALGSSERPVVGRGEVFDLTREQGLREGRSSLGPAKLDLFLECTKTREETRGQGQGRGTDEAGRRPSGEGRDSSAGNTPRCSEAANGTSRRRRRVVRIVIPGDSDGSEDQIYHDSEDFDYGKVTGDHKGTNRVHTNNSGGDPIYHGPQDIVYAKATTNREDPNRDYINDLANDLIYHDSKDVGNDQAIENHEDANRVRTNDTGGNLIYHGPQDVVADEATANHEDPSRDHPNDFNKDQIYHDSPAIDNSGDDSEFRSDEEHCVMFAEPVEALIKDRLLAQDFSKETLTLILNHVFGTHGERLPRRGAMPRKTAFGSDDGGDRRISLGYYTYGGLRGICNNTPGYASLSIYLKYYILHRDPGAKWTSLAISLDNEAKIHGDYHNLRGTYNYLTCAGDFTSGGGLWRERSKGEHIEEELVSWRQDEKGTKCAGTVLPTLGEVAKFSGERRHATEPWEGGHRWSITCFTTRSYIESTKEEKRRLRQWGYPVPDLRYLTPDRKVLRMPGATDESGPSKRFFPKYSQRKSLWKSAMRASAFLTWSLTSLSTAQAMLTSSGDNGVSLLEIGSLSQTLEAANINGVSIAEPISWRDLLEPGGTEQTIKAVREFEPNVVWISADEFYIPPKAPRDRWEQVCSAINACVQEQVSGDRSLVVETRNLPPPVRDELHGQLSELGNVTEHSFDEVQFLKVRPRRPTDVYVSEGGELVDQATPERTGAAGISFEKGVKSDVAATLRRLHQNLGHPAVPDLVRHLRLAGASTEVLKAAKSLSCETCRRCHGPRSPKPASEPKLVEFGEVVGVDMMFAYDIEKKKHKLLSIVDYASSYHVVVKVPNQTGSTLEKEFLKHWVQIFGAPKTITLDLETGIQDAFSRLSDWFQIDLQTSAGQAHWQAGFCERHGKWWKEIFARLVEDQTVNADDIETAIGATSAAKNNLRRKCGWAPCQIVFGKTPRDEDDIYDKEIDEGNFVPQTSDDAQRRRESIRSAAKAAFLRVRAEDKIRRGSLQRSRVRPRDLPSGEMALFWRKDKNNKKGAWRGPGVVIGRQQENYWIARGGRCFLCAPEHVRGASPEELGGLFALRATREDLQRLIERGHDDEDAFIEEEPGDYDIDDYAPTEDEDATMEEELEFTNGDLDPAPPNLRRPPGELGDDSLGPRPVRRRHRRKEPQEAMMMKRATTQRGREKQLEKELPWRLIPLEMQAEFRAAERKQWQEHLTLKALRPLSVTDSERVLREEGDRIIGCRFAYRDKNLARRRTNPDAEWRPKARLVVAGHLDPDVKSGALRTDSPTVSRTAVMCILQVTAARLHEGWSVAAGDVTAAFLNGDALERKLYLRQPKHGLPDLHPSQLIVIEKGVFGLIDSPRKWWKKFRNDIQDQVIDLGTGENAKFFNSALDPCVFQLMKVDANGEVLEGSAPSVMQRCTLMTFCWRDPDD